MTRRVALAVIAVVLFAIAGAPAKADAARTSAAGIDLSSLPAIEAYLASIGVDLTSVVVQQGPRNYAGADCPGEGWNCTGAGVVIQIAPATLSALNVFDCGPGSTGSTDPGTNTCVVVQSSDSGNFASCHEGDSGSAVMQKCTITQTSTTGDNRALVDQFIRQPQSDPTQDATQTAKVTQTSTTGNNQARVAQSIRQELSAHLDLTQVQEAHQRATVGQTATGGANSSQVLQSVSQEANAESNAAITQEQNAASGGPNTSAEITQTSGSGTNDSTLTQRNRQHAVAKSPAGPITQTQGSLTGGLKGKVHQVSSGVSTSVARQDEDQTLHAETNGTLTQTQHGPEDCCSNQSTNTDDTFGIKQRVVQLAQKANQTDKITGNCDSSGECMVAQTVDNDAGTTTNTCTSTSCHLSISCSTSDGTTTCFAPPSVTAISPTSGPAAGGTVVTITGTGFSTTAGATTVKFGTTGATGVSCATTTSCSATSPAGSGTVDVRVTVGGHTSATSAADQFTYTTTDSF